MSNRWALVVGASRGLGLELAAELKSRGWNVVGTVRDDGGERRLRKLADKPGGELRVERLDINDDGQIATLRRRLDGTVFDLVFVNAGIAPKSRGDAAGASRDEAAAVFMTNAVAPIRVARAFLDRVRNGPGIIAFMSSGLGSVANKTDSYSDLYSASKAALTGRVAHSPDDVPAAALQFRREPQPQPARRPYHQRKPSFSHCKQT